MQTLTCYGFILKNIVTKLWLVAFSGGSRITAWGWEGQQHPRRGFSEMQCVKTKELGSFDKDGSMTHSRPILTPILVLPSQHEKSNLGSHNLLRDIKALSKATPVPHRLVLQFHIYRCNLLPLGMWSQVTEVGAGRSQV